MEAIAKLLSVGSWIIPVIILAAFLLPQMIRVLLPRMLSRGDSFLLSSRRRYFIAIEVVLSGGYRVAVA